MTYTEDIILAASTANLPWEKLSGKNILITGATGLIGGCLVEILMSHPGLAYHVYASGRNEARVREVFAAYTDSPWFHFLKHDVTEPLCSSVSFHYIIAAASGANPMVYSTDPVGVMKANLQGADHLLRYGVDHEMEKFVYVSSGDVYGQGDGRVMKENYSGYADPLDLRSCYVSAKRATETLCISYASQYGIDASIARPCHTYGPHFTSADSRAYAQFIRNVVRGEDIVMKSAGEQVRSWCYVVDCALGILFVMLKGEKGQAYNVADEESCISIRDLAEAIAEGGNRKLRYENPSDQEKRGFNKVTQSLFDTARLKALGWQPLQGDIRRKLKTTINEVKNEQ